MRVRFLVREEKFSKREEREREKGKYKRRGKKKEKVRLDIGNSLALFARFQKSVGSWRECKHSQTHLVHSEGLI